jgi:hypothetical protein
MDPSFLSSNSYRSRISKMGMIIISDLSTSVVQMENSRCWVDQEITRKEKWSEGRKWSYRLDKVFDALETKLNEISRHEVQERKYSSVFMQMESVLECYILHGSRRSESGWGCFRRKISVGSIWHQPVSHMFERRILGRVSDQNNFWQTFETPDGLKENYKTSLHIRSDSTIDNFERIVASKRNIRKHCQMMLRLDGVRIGIHSEEFRRERNSGEIFQVQGLT